MVRPSQKNGVERKEVWSSGDEGYLSVSHLYSQALLSEAAEP